MTRSLSRPGRPAAIVAAAVAVATGAHGAQATGSVTIEPPVSAKVTQDLRLQTRITLGTALTGGNVASLSVPGEVNATGPDGGDVQLPTVLAPDGALSVPPDTSVSVNTSGALPGGGPYEGVMLVLVQFN